AKMAGMARPMRTVRGRIKRWKKRHLVVEIELQEDVDWAPESTARVALSDGTGVNATVDAGATTRAGAVGSGRTIRLTLLLDVETGARPERVTIGGLVIEVQ